MNFDGTGCEAFLMYRVELKALRAGMNSFSTSFVPNVPCGVESHANHDKP